MKALNKDENLAITGGYFPPTDEQLEKLNRFELPPEYAYLSYNQ